MKYEGDEDGSKVTCPKCGKPATQRVIDRDQQCSRCSLADEMEHSMALTFAVKIATADVSLKGIEDVNEDTWADTVWRLARALAKRGRK